MKQILVNLAMLGFTYHGDERVYEKVSVAKIGVNYANRLVAQRLCCGVAYNADVRLGYNAATGKQWQPEDWLLGETDPEELLQAVRDWNRLIVTAYDEANLDLVENRVDPKDAVSRLITTARERAGICSVPGSHFIIPGGFEDGMTTMLTNEMLDDIKAHPENWAIIQYNEKER